MRLMIGLAAVALCAPLILSASSATAQAPAARNYDCSKAGNANKAACKTAAPAAKPMSAPAAKPAAARNYDCSKPGNANKAACKSAVAAAPKPGPKPASVAKPAPKPTAKPMAARPAPMVANGNARVVEWTTKTGKVVHYDCSKAGNYNKTACK